MTGRIVTGRVVNGEAEKVFPAVWGQAVVSPPPKMKSSVIPNECVPLSCCSMSDSERKRAHTLQLSDTARMVVGDDGERLVMCNARRSRTQKKIGAKSTTRVPGARTKIGYVTVYLSLSHIKHARSYVRQKGGVVGVFVVWKVVVNC